MRKPDAVDLALEAIMRALYPDCEDGWNEWSSYAASGEWF